MYFASQLVFAIIAAFIITLIFVAALRRPGPWNNVLVFFLIILLTAWAAAIWIGPVGPAFLGIFWLPIIVVGFIAALLLTSVRSSPRPRTQTVSAAYEQEQKREQVKSLFDIFFWILIGLLFLIILFGVMRPRVFAVQV